MNREIDDLQIKNEVPKVTHACMHEGKVRCFGFFFFSASSTILEISQGPIGSMSRNQVML